MTEAKLLVDIDNFLAEHRRKLAEDKKVLNEILNFLEKKQQALVLDCGNYSQSPCLNKIDQKSSTCVENYKFYSPEIYEDEHPRVMVRYGEFSPLNPVFRSNSRPILGLGEYEEKRKLFLEKKKREYQQYLSKVKNEKEQEKAKSKLPSTNTRDENHPRLTNIAEVNSAKSSPRNLNMPREVLSPGRGVVEVTDRCYARWQQQMYRRELDRQVMDKKKRMKEEKERERLECEKKQKETMMEQLKLSRSIAEQIRRYQMTEMSQDAATTNEEQNLAGNHENQVFIEDVNMPDPSSTSVRSLGFNPVPRIMESPPHTTSNSIFNAISPPKTPEHISNQITNSIFNSLSDQPRKYSPIQEVITPIDEYNSSPSPKNSVSKSISNGESEHLQLQKPITNGLNLKAGRVSNQKSQQEIYKNELARQIEEKKRLEMERKRKEAEEEKRIEEKVKLEEERLRKEFEKEQAEQAYRANQRVQQEVRLQQHLSKVQKEAEDRKKNIRQVNNASVASKPSVYPTNHGATNQGAMKNVSFAPKACVYAFPNTHESVQNDNVVSNANENHTRDTSQIIVEAPYVLAIKGNQESIDNSSNVKIYERRPRSPPVPAIRTQEMLLKSLPRLEVEIPSTVSMSPDAKEKFLKEAKILSNLPEIRRRLLLKHSGLESK